MCGRFTLTADPSQLEDLFPWAVIPTAIPPRYNISPTQSVAVIPNAKEFRVDFYRWGLIPSWAKDAEIGQRMINARTETLTDKPSFSKAFKERRCLILADGFYEWMLNPESKLKTPYYIHLISGAAFAFAGLWDMWKAPDGSRVHSCAIITTTPNSLIAPIHNRMPVILTGEACVQYLNTGANDSNKLKRLLTPLPESVMEAYPVSRAVNDPKTDQPSLINRV